MTAIDVNFDDLVSGDEAPASDPTPAVATTPTPGNGNSKPYPITVTVQNENEVPDGCESVTAFAERLTRQNLFAEFQAQAEGRQYDGPTGQVFPPSVYSALKAQRNPLPHVVARTADGSSERVFVLIEPALKAWANRGTSRGEVGGDPEKIVLRAGKRMAKLGELEKRLAKVTAATLAQKKLVEKSAVQLNDIGKTWEDAEKAYAADVASGESTDNDDNDE